MTQDSQALVRAIQSSLEALEAVPRALLLAGLALVTLLATITIGRSAWLAQPSSRRPWAAVVLTCLVLATGWGAMVAGAPAQVTSLIMHPLGLACAGIGVMAFPGVRRPARAWMLASLDGWMSVGGAAAIICIFLEPVMEVLGRHPDRLRGHRPVDAGPAVMRDAHDADEAVARLGGDEFAVLMPAAGPRTGEHLAAEVLDRLAKIRTPEHLHLGQASIGIVSGPAGSPEEALRDADLAMYQAKASGGGLAVRFEPWMRERMIERSRLRAELEGAIGASGLSRARPAVPDAR